MQVGGSTTPASADACLHCMQAVLGCPRYVVAGSFVLLSTACAPPTVFLVPPAARCLPAVPPAAALFRGALAPSGCTGAPAGLPGGLQRIPDAQGNAG